MRTLKREMNAEWKDREEMEKASNMMEEFEWK
jgi:hypothetical protein